MNIKKKFFNCIFLLILIFPTSCLSTDSISSSNSSISAPSIYSDCVLLVEKESGDILFEKNAYDKMYPASTTKMLTAIIVLENSYLNEIVTVSHSALAAVPASYVTANLEQR